MSADLLTPAEALRRLGERTATAAAEVMEMFVPGEVVCGEVQTPVDAQEHPLGSLPSGTILMGVSYTSGGSGANIFAFDLAAARTLATRMGAPPPDPVADETGAAVDLTELELSALSEASNQMIAATAIATGAVLGEEVEISHPVQHVVGSGDAAEIYGQAPHASVTPIGIAGETCQLIQLVPVAFIAKMNQAFSELEEAGQDEAGASGAASHSAVALSGLHRALAGVDLGVWVEIGRTHMTMGEALALPGGAVVALDRRVGAPVDLIVDGEHWAHGQLIVTDDGRWAFRCDTLVTTVPETAPEPDPTPVSPADPTLERI